MCCCSCSAVLIFLPDNQTARLPQHESSETAPNRRNERNGPPRTHGQKDGQTDNHSVTQSVSQSTVELVGAQADWSVGHQSGRPRVRRTRVLSLDRDQIPCRFSHWALLPSRPPEVRPFPVAGCQLPGVRPPRPESTPHPAAPTFHRRPSWHPGHPGSTAAQAPTQR